jgi:hypothetical protein
LNRDEAKKKEGKNREIREIREWGKEFTAPAFAGKLRRGGEEDKDRKAEGDGGTEANEGNEERAKEFFSLGTGCVKEGA